ncbi:MAG TPA: NmrA/HSCARG family protein [Bryobacteraceae bacterium]
MPANKNKNKSILVTGATGHQGGAVLRHLRERGFACRALTRDPAKPQARTLMAPGVEVIRGDQEDQTSLVHALEGAYGAFAVQNLESGVDAEIRQGINMIDAAKRSRITHYVYSSVGAADQKTGIPHFESKFRIEEHLRGSGMQFTIVRPVFFMENWLGMRQAIDNGTIALPLDPATRLQMIAVDDIGGVVAAAFEHSGKWQGRALDIAGDELSMSELAQVFSRVAGREVSYQQVPWNDFEARAGHEMTVMYRWFQDVGYHTDISAVRQEYPKLTTFDRWLNSNWHTATRTA